MAANNYFGFTHGGTQYSTTPAAGYQAGQTGYAVGHATQSYAAAPRAGQATAYDGYQTTHTSNAYSYGSRQQDAAPPPPPSSNPTYESYGYARSTNTGYDGTKAYYQQPAQSSYSTTDTHYQSASKPSYTTNSSFTSASRQTTNPKTAATTSTYGYSSGTGTPSYSSNYGSTATTTASYTDTNYPGYDAALYSAATIYVQQQQQANTTTTNKNQTGWTAYKKGNVKQNKPKQPPKPQQLHYCDVCKISCAGPQTYREHLEGQKHKKKEAAAKAGAAAQTARGGNSLRCELCDVTCTGADAYAAHIRGAKHQKVVKLHTKLGKPIPSTEPVVVTNNSTTTTTSATSGAKINSSTAASPNDVKELKPEEMKDDTKQDSSKLEDKPEIQPVGQDYIEEIKNDEGKVISFQCKLCECRFNDPNAKEMHMKGRRHRLQYKKKVNPDLVVDIKPSLRQRKLQEEKLRRQQMKEEIWRRREEERWRDEMRAMEEEERHYWEERRRYEEEMEYYEWFRRYGRDPRAMPPPPRPFPAQPPSGPPLPMRRPDSSDDRHVISKHAQIYPKEEELQAVQKIITNTEKALKLVSDYLAESENMTPKKEPEVKEGADSNSPPTTNNKENSDKRDESLVPPRVLKGVMRVGVLAKGLLLHGDLNVHLAVMCSEKPTRTLLGKVADNLPKQLATVTDEKYEVKRCIEEAAILVTASSEPKTSVTITLTSPVMRETNHPEGGVVEVEHEAHESLESVNVKDPPDVLDRQKCLDALAALRHAKWFQARANGLQSCVVVIRILRDLCQRVPTWAPLNSWAMELLVEKVISSAGQPLSPGDALRRVFEAISSGVLLPGGPGLLDPCEKDPVDAAASLSNQEREDITASAQHALRLLAFRQIHKVLGMDPLPPPKFTRARYNRKRRRDNSAGESVEEVTDGKKDKKEEAEKTDTMEVQEPETKA